MQLFCSTVLILTKTLPNMKFIYFLSNVNIFNKNFENIPLFFIKITQRSLSKFKFQNSKISLALLRRFLVVKTEILVLVACLRCLRSFQAAINRLRDVDVTMTLTSTGIVIRGLPDGCLSILLPDCRKLFADDKLFVHYIQNCVARQQHVYLLQDVKNALFL